MPDAPARMNSEMQVWPLSTDMTPPSLVRCSQIAPGRMVEPYLGQSKSETPTMTPATSFLFRGRTPSTISPLTP